MNTQDILGTGWAFPLQLDPQGRVAQVHGSVNVEHAIQMILLTRKGERIMRPEFGSQLHELVFEPNDEMTMGLAAQYVRDALAMWEPRIRVEAVDVTSDDDDASVMHISIQYEIKATHDKRSLVLPYFSIPGE